MKKIALSIFLLSGMVPVFSQENTVPFIEDGLLGIFMSPDGKIIVAQDQIGNLNIIDASTKQVIDTDNNYPGNGNCASNTGLIVGQSILEQKAVLINQKGNHISLPKLESYPTSSLNGITSDGTRMCGYVSRTLSQVVAEPFYCDINPDGTVSAPVLLPYPSKDLLGDTPQFVTAVWISDDGKTISGQVMDGSGFYSYPIVYRQDGSEWKYILPSETMFNPNHLEMPVWPKFTATEPDVTSFMTAANKEKWEKDMEDYNNDETGSVPNPWKHLSDYLSEKELADYQDALNDYNEQEEEYYSKIDEYWDTLTLVTKDSNFALGLMAMNAEGSILASPLQISYEEGMSDIADEYQMVVFDLENENYKKIESQYKMVVPHQVLDNGTIVAIDPLYYSDYFLSMGDDEYITFEEYLSKNYPAWLSWIKENLTVGYNTSAGIEYVLAGGLLTFSQDGATMVGGCNTYDDFFTYIFQSENAGIEAIEWPEVDKVTVYNLMGIKVIEATQVEEIKKLPKGIYVINGKKVAL